MFFNLIRKPTYYETFSEGLAAGRRSGVETGYEAGWRLGREEGIKVGSEQTRRSIQDKLDQIAQMYRRYVRDQSDINAGLREVIADLEKRLKEAGKA